MNKIRNAKGRYCSTYTKELETEVMNLKVKNRELEETNKRYSEYGNKMYNQYSNEADAFSTYKTNIKWFKEAATIALIAICFQFATCFILYLVGRDNTEVFRNYTYLGAFLELIYSIAWMATFWHTDHKI